ncbi:hypothetical protein HOD29_06260 [archaeon]|nr:hypothetical protein [archaeon]
MNKEFNITNDCKHKSNYRFWYNEDYLIERCRSCFREREIKDRLFLLEDYHDLTAGGFKKTPEDNEKYKAYQEKLNEIENLDLEI